MTPDQHDAYLREQQKPLLDALAAAVEAAVKREVDRACGPANDNARPAP